jgi:hypothetical protein
MVDIRIVSQSSRLEAKSDRDRRPPRFEVGPACNVMEVVLPCHAQALRGLQSLLGKFRDECVEYI